MRYDKTVEIKQQQPKTLFTFVAGNPKDTKQVTQQQGKATINNLNE